MKLKTPVFLCLLAISWLGAQACWTDNKPEYEGIEAVPFERDTDEPTDPETDPEETETEGTSDAPTDAETESTDVTVTEATETEATDTDAMSDDMMSGADDMAGSGDGGATDGVGDTNMDEDPESDCEASDTVVDPDSSFYPPCCLGPALNGEEIKKGTQCTADDVQHCYRVCGPFQLGWKTEDCLAGVYAEGDCGFPPDDENTKERLLLETGTEDFSCFAIPDEIDTSICPQDAPPKSTDPCDIPECTLCNLRTLYRDTNDNTKEGYCVCRKPDANGERTWTCASITAWPCPFSEGCG